MSGVLIISLTLLELPNIIRAEHFLTQAQYTKAGNLNVNTTHNRIRSKLIASVKIDGHLMIDISQSPPAKRYPPNEKRPREIPQLPDDVNYSELAHVSSYARRNKRTADNFFEAMLSGKIFGLVLGTEVFAYKNELANI